MVVVVVVCTTVVAVVTTGVPVCASTPDQVHDDASDYEYRQHQPNPAGGNEVGESAGDQGDTHQAEQSTTDDVLDRPDRCPQASDSESHGNDREGHRPTFLIF